MKVDLKSFLLGASLVAVGMIGTLAATSPQRDFNEVGRYVPGGIGNHISTYDTKTGDIYMTVYTKGEGAPILLLNPITLNSRTVGTIPRAK